MANRSEDEWSLVSEDEEVLSDLSFDEVEPELEVQPKSDPEVTVPKQQKAPVIHDDGIEVSAEEETADILSLLADSSVSERSTAGYSREIRVSLLSPAHQAWLVGAPPRYSSPPSTAASRKRNVKLAFIESDARPKSFPARLRAITAAKRPLSEEVAPPAFTEVKPFTLDQSTQVDLDATAAEPHETRATLLRASLERSMTMATQIRSKSQDNERLSFRIAELESVLVQTEQKAQRNATKIKLNERRLALVKQQAKLTAEYQDNLTTTAENLRHDNAELAAQNAALRGEDEAMAGRSLDELEELETMLARGMDNVRAALRAKYRAAVDKRHEKELCVVCFAKPVSVVLLPCRHQVLCVSCAVRVMNCPIDRKDIQDKVLTYGLNAYTDSDNCM